MRFLNNMLLLNKIITRLYLPFSYSSFALSLTINRMTRSENIKKNDQTDLKFSKKLIFCPNTL